MDNEIMESVLTEILEEQKSGAKAMQGLSASIKALTGAVDSFQTKLDQKKVVAPPADTRLVQEIVADGILKIQEIVAGHPKTVTRNFRLLLFPEMYAENYYRIVFGRLLFWMLIALTGSYLFVLGKQGINSWQSIKEKEVDGNQYKQAWLYLYRREKPVRSKMDSAWFKSH